MAELVHHGTPLAEVAGLSWLQIRWLYFRERDKHAALVRPGTPEADDYQPARVDGPGVGFGEGWWKSIYRACSARWKGKLVRGKVFEGWTEADLDTRWKAYLESPDGWELKGRLGVGRERPPAFKPSVFRDTDFKPRNGFERGAGPLD